MRPTDSTTGVIPLSGGRAAFHDRPVLSADHARRLMASTPSGSRSVRTAPCPHCTPAIDRALHFCPHCGLKTGFTEVHPTFCGSCGTRMDDDDAFCAACGEPLKGGLDAPGRTVGRD